MAHLPYGRNSGPIKNKKELGDILFGMGLLIGFVSILSFSIMLYAKSYRSSNELLVVAGIPGAISLILLVLGSIFRRKNKGIAFGRLRASVIEQKRNPSAKSTINRD